MKTVNYIVINYLIVKKNSFSQIRKKFKGIYINNYENKTIYYLETTLGSQSARVPVFKPMRDGGHNIVYSLVDEDGFYLSYDKVSWEIIDTWHK